MQNITVLLLGVTGDLAKLKVLPAINQFAARNRDKYNTKLIGYSRSNPDKELTIDSLKKGSSDNQVHVSNIEYITDSYDNVDRYNEVFEKMSENCRIIIYLAVPPSVFIPFLRSTCPLNPHQIDIVIEKPFGRDSEEAKELIDITNQCKLTDRIHFFDHYLFKQSTFLPDEVKTQLNNNSYLTGIKLRAIESVGVVGRAGYYDRTGAFEDMWQHLVSLVNIISEQLDLGMDWGDFVPDDTIIGQYDGYKSDVENDTSQTDSYFKVIGNFGEADFIAESGKQLGQKTTDVVLDFENGDTIEWNIDKQRYVKLNGERVYSWSENTEKVDDHTILLERVMDGELDRFVTKKQVLESWKTYELVYPIKARTPVMPYKPGIYQPQFIS